MPPPCTRARPAFAVALPGSAVRALVALDRLLAAALALVRDAAPEPRLAVPVVDVEGRVEVLDRLVELVRRDEALAWAA